MHRIMLAATITMAMPACSGSSGSLMPAPTAPGISRPEPTFTVSGAATGERGVPLEGVLVRVAGRSGVTDGGGRYRLDGVPASYGGASAVKPGYASARQILTVSADADVDFDLGARLAIYPLSGVISESTPAGLVPIAGAIVEEYSCEEVTPMPPFFSGSCPSTLYQRTTTDARGAYRFSGLYPGKANTIVVTKEGFGDPAEEVPGNSGHDSAGHTVVIRGDTRFDLQLTRP
jgi:hypothetical protein